MRKIDDEIQALLLEHRGDIRSILKDNHRLDLLYALSSQRELLLEWYDFEPEAEVLQVGADYGAHADRAFSIQRARSDGAG